MRGWLEPYGLPGVVTTADIQALKWSQIYELRESIENLELTRCLSIQDHDQLGLSRANDALKGFIRQYKHLSGDDFPVQSCANILIQPQ